MATFALLSGLIAFGIYFYAFFSLAPDVIAERPITASLWFNMFVLAFIMFGFIGLWIIGLISDALYLDIYSVVPVVGRGIMTVEKLRYSAIYSAVALGTSSLFSFMLGKLRIRSETSKNDQIAKTQNISLKLILEIIGFLGSALGIISFYLDYLK